MNKGKEKSGDELMRAEIMQHPLFKDLLAAHTACSRVGTTSTDHFPHVRRPLLLSTSGNEELDYFMAFYVSMLTSLAENLQPIYMEATMAFKSIEQELFDLSGTFETNMASDSSIPKGSEMSLAKMMKQKLKLELKEDYEVKIKQVWEKIGMKRGAHKLPVPCTVSSILKNWLNNHLDWPYPTKEEKEMLMIETGLELNQLCKWFINQRNRHWNR